MLTGDAEGWGALPSDDFLRENLANVAWLDAVFRRVCSAHCGRFLVVRGREVVFSAKTWGEGEAGAGRNLGTGEAYLVEQTLGGLLCPRGVADKSVPGGCAR